MPLQVLRLAPVGPGRLTRPNSLQRGKQKRRIDLKCQFETVVASCEKIQNDDLSARIEAITVWPVC